MVAKFTRTLAAIVVGAMLSVSALAGPPATDFTLRDIDGKQVTLSSYKGKVVLLSFWATWCGPCKVEMAHLSQMYNELEDQGFVVLSVSSDDAKTASQVKPYIMRKRYKFPVVLDKDSSVTMGFNPTKTLPYGVLVGRDGNISQTYSGYQPGDEVKVEADVKALLGT